MNMIIAVMNRSCLNDITTWKRRTKKSSCSTSWSEKPPRNEPISWRPRSSFSSSIPADGDATLSKRGWGLRVLLWICLWLIHAHTTVRSRDGISGRIDLRSTSPGTLMFGFPTSFPWSEPRQIMSTLPLSTSLSCSRSTNSPLRIKRLNRLLITCNERSTGLVILNVGTRIGAGRWRSLFNGFDTNMPQRDPWANAGNVFSACDCAIGGRDFRRRRLLLLRCTGLTPCWWWWPRKESESEEAAISWLWLVGASTSNPSVWDSCVSSVVIKDDWSMRWWWREEELWLPWRGKGG